jgi:hypothetical protein
LRDFDGDGGAFVNQHDRSRVQVAGDALGDGGHMLYNAVKAACAPPHHFQSQCMGEKGAACRDDLH